MIKENVEVLGSAPCLTFLILRGLCLDLCVRTGCRITGVMLGDNGSGTGIRLLVVTIGSGVYQYNARISGNAVGTVSVSQRCSSRLGAVSDDLPAAGAGNALRGGSIVQRDDHLAPLTGSIVVDLPCGTAVDSCC